MVPKREPKSVQNRKKADKRDAEIEVEHRCEKSAVKHRKRTDTGDHWVVFWDRRGLGGTVFQYCTGLYQCNLTRPAPVGAVDTKWVKIDHGAAQG